MKESPNPYAAPREHSMQGATPRPAYHPVAALVYFAAWSALAGGVWLARAKLVPIFQDFDAELPAVSQLVVHPLYAVGIVVAGVVSAAAICAVRDLALNRRLRALSIIALGGLALVSVYALFQPLIILIDALK